MLVRFQILSVNQNYIRKNLKKKIGNVYVLDDPETEISAIRKMKINASYILKFTF